LFLFKGWLHLIQNPHEIRKSRQCFSRAIQIAKEMGAKSEELTAVIAMAKLLKQQGRSSQAHELLSKIYNWFSEGFDTPEMQKAKALLDELA
ncbi:MAG TPA: hypothetical protein VJ728_06600, partial [Candidatus Binataceae bacterium]|nr:hypothetical protein [Candidatus Binataceae bacterium]